MLRLALSMGIILMLSGCIIPFPHVKKICAEIEGKVIKEGTEVPIQSAEINVKYCDGKYRKTLSDTNGEFHFPPKHCFYWGILFGVALNHSWPLDECCGGNFSKMDVTAEDYLSVRIYPWRHLDISKETSEGEYALIELEPKHENDKFIFPAIMLKPKMNQ